MVNYCVYKGASTGFWTGVSQPATPLFHVFLICNWFDFLFQDVRFLMEDARELKPTIFCGVPRVYERIYTSLFLSSDSYILKLFRPLTSFSLPKKVFTKRSPPEERWPRNYSNTHTTCTRKSQHFLILSEDLIWSTLHFPSKLRNLRRGLKQDLASPLFDRLVFNKVNARVPKSFPQLTWLCFRSDQASTGREGADPYLRGGAAAIKRGGVLAGRHVQRRYPRIRWEVEAEEKEDVEEVSGSWSLIFVMWTSRADRELRRVLHQHS